MLGRERVHPTYYLLLKSLKRLRLHVQQHVSVQTRKRVEFFCNEVGGLVFEDMDGFDKVCSFLRVLHAQARAFPEEVSSAGCCPGEESEKGRLFAGAQ